jgi:hypothetical protein
MGYSERRSRYQRHREETRRVFEEGKALVPARIQTGEKSYPSSSVAPSQALVSKATHFTYLVRMRAGALVNVTNYEMTFERSSSFEMLFLRSPLSEV